jgi:hypothetical protein
MFRDLCNVKEDVSSPADLREHWRDGRIKMHVTARALQGECQLVRSRRIPASVCFGLGAPARRCICQASRNAMGRCCCAAVLDRSRRDRSMAAGRDHLGGDGAPIARGSAERASERPDRCTGGLAPQ